MHRKIEFLYQLFWKIKNILLSLLISRTVGVRALVIKGDEILLVKHSYQPGWYTIGGAVERGESPLNAIVRELAEEVGITAISSLKLMGIYLNNFEKRDDYVALYIVQNFEMHEVQCKEISDKKWFNIAQLPSEATPATIRRIEEYKGLRKQSDKW
jgi:ADP-ribose pyrophosphatase YjhB (NUDIX family)